MAVRTMRERYVNDNVATASPAQLVTMLYDALVMDLNKAETACATGELFQINERLCHAQAIVMELHSSLDATKWSGATYLAQLYTYWIEQMIEANMNKDAEQIILCREQIEPLRDAWKQAAEQSE